MELNKSRIKRTPPDVDHFTSRYRAFHGKLIYVLSEPKCPRSEMRPPSSTEFRRGDTGKKERRRGSARPRRDRVDGANTVVNDEDQAEISVDHRRRSQKSSSAENTTRKSSEINNGHTQLLGHIGLDLHPLEELRRMYRKEVSILWREVDHFRRYCLQK
ncbi:hypothetical protein MAR_000852, partial [Mya arenaria]